MGIKQGAGIIPFTRMENQLHFLFHKTFSGRRAGLLVDFGGGSITGETQFQTAAREFVEETEAMFFADHPAKANLKQQSEAQIRIVLDRLLLTQQKHPDWWCQRRSAPDKSPKDWKTFFVEMEYKSLHQMNRLWAENPQGRFKKRRELIWLDSAQLLNLFIDQPDKLWTRVRELESADSVIQSIVNSQPSLVTNQY